MKQQVLVIHGGDSFDSKEEYLDNLKTKEINLKSLKYYPNWKNALAEDLGEEYEVFVPKMPNNANAQYKEWKLWFERIVALLENDLILIGHSLGGVFLAKYLSENNLNKHIKALVLAAAPYQAPDGLGQFKLKTSLQKLDRQTPKILLVQSEDDLVVPIEEVDMYKEALPKAKMMIFKDRGHFDQAHFPELVNYIKTIKF